MKHIDEIYKEWCGSTRLENSVKEVHDSAEAIEFAEFYHKERMKEKAKEFEQLKKNPIMVLNAETGEISIASEKEIIIGVDQGSPEGDYSIEMQTEKADEN